MKRKYPLLIKCNAAFPTSYLQQQLILWGASEPNKVPTRSAEVLTAINTYLEENLQLTAKKLKVYFFALQNKLYLLNASPPLEANNPAWINLQVKGLGAVSAKLGDDPKDWDRFTFTDPSHISDPIARLQAEELSNPLKFDSAFKIERKSTFDMSEISREDAKDNTCDALLEEGSFLYDGSTGTNATPVPSISQEREEEESFVPETSAKTEVADDRDDLVSLANHLRVNALETETAMSAKDIRIQKFNPETMDAQTWVGNQVFELELSGFRSEQKMIAKLLSGLPDELRYAVRTDLQQSFPKVNDAYSATIADFLDILKTHAMQTQADMMESLAMLKLGTNKDLRRFYYQIKSLVDSTLDDKQRASGVSELLATAKFKEKLPNHLKNNQLIASSTESGLKLVGLAQRVMNRCKSDSIASNSFQTKKSWNGKYNGKKGGKKGGKNKDTDKRDKDVTCDFCGLKGHAISNCYSFQAAKKLRREELAAKKSSSSKN